MSNLHSVAVLVLLLALTLPMPLILAQDEEPVPHEDPEAAALLLIDGIMKQVEAARGLKFKEDFTRELISPDQIREMMQEMQDEEMSPEELAAMTRLYARMGFFSPEVDLVELMTDMLEAGALGFYDPDKKGLYLVRGFTPDGAVYYRYNGQAVQAAPMRPPEFCINAVGDLDGDSQNGGYEVQSSNGVGSTAGALDCDAGAYAGGPCETNMTVDSEMLDCAVGIF